MNRKDNRNAVLGDLYQFQYGTGNTIEDIGGDYPIYGSNGAVGFTNIYNSEDAPVIGHIGAYAGIVNWASGKHFVTYNGVICKIKDGVNPKFGYYSLLNSGLQKRLRGSTQPFVSYDLLDEVKTYLPDKKIQDNIAKTLSEIDAKIELNNKINSELEQMVKTIYDYWFVQFDFPNKNGKSYKANKGKMVWSEELKREIPDGWEIKHLKDIFEFEKGIEPGSSEYLNFPENDNCIKFFRVGDIEGESSIYIDSTNKKDKKVEEKDVVVTFDGSVGKIGLGLNGAISGGLRKIYDKSKKYNNSLVYFIFRDERIIATIHKYATGSILLHASSSIDYLKIPFEKSVYLKFQEITTSFFDQIVKNKRENFKLVELRDWLLPMLMNGQVVVK